MEYIYIATILILFLPDLLTCEKTSSFTCNDGWRLRGSMCYKWGSSPQTYSMAVSECQNMNANLQMMFNREQNLHFMVNGTSAAGGVYWLGLRFDLYMYRSQWKLSDGKEWSQSQYSNWNAGSPSFSRNLKCVEWHSLTGKWQSTNCFNQKLFLCQKSAECVSGRYGTDCSNECHCLGQACKHHDGVCPYGCSMGWMGKHCEKRKTKAEAIFYCISTVAKQNEMIFSGDQNGIYYRRIRALDKVSNPVDTCDSKVFTVRNSSRYGQVMLKLVKAKHGFEPKCGEEEISSNTYKWRFEFKEFPATRSAYDVTFEVQCNFSAAEKLQRSADMSNQISSNQSEPLSETRLSVSLDIVDVITNKLVQAATVGQPVKLVMEFKNQNAIGVKKVAPHSCAAGTEDGSQSIVFMDDNGCPKQGAQIVFSKGNGTKWWSERFEMFSFSSSDHVVFTCSFDICFSNEDRTCFWDRCSRNETVVAEAGNRTRRALTYLLTGNKLVGAKVKITSKIQE